MGKHPSINALHHIKSSRDLPFINMLFQISFYRYNGASAVINWLLNFDLNANQDILNVSAHTKILSSLHSHQHYYSNSTAVRQRSDGRNGISTNTGSLYLYNQGEFYFNTPQVICVMCI